MDDSKFKDELSKPTPIVGGQVPGRNESCPCGSGLKFKQCHGDGEKKQLVQKLAVAFMELLIRRAQMEKGLVPWPFTCFSCGKGFMRAKNSTVAPGRMLCPHCGSPNFVGSGTPELESESAVII